MKSTQRVGTMDFGGFRGGLVEEVIEFRMRFSNTVHNHLSFAT